MTSIPEGSHIPGKDRTTTNISSSEDSKNTATSQYSNMKVTVLGADKTGSFITRKVGNQYGVTNQCTGNREISVLYDNKKDLNQCYVNLKKAFNDLDDVHYLLLSNANEDLGKLLDKVMGILDQLNESSNINLKNEILEGLNNSDKEISTAVLLQGIRHTLINISLMMKSIKTNKRTIIKSKTNKHFNAAANTKLYANMLTSQLEPTLQQAIIEGDVKCVDQILEQCGENVAKFDLQKLSHLALSTKKADGVYVLQLLVNKKLFKVDGLESVLDETIAYSKENKQIRMEKLLTKIQSGVDLEELQAYVPVAIGEISGKNSEEHLTILKDYINANKLSAVENMIKLGMVDLLDLNDEQLFSILEETAKKIKPKTMRLLLNNGFNINAKNSRNENILYIINKFNSNDVLSLLAEQKDIKKLFDEKSGLNDYPLQFHVSKNNLDAVKILFKKFGAIINTTHHNENKFFSTAIKNKDVKMVEYLLQQVRDKSDPDVKQHADRNSLIIFANDSANPTDEALHTPKTKKDQKKSQKIAQLIKKGFQQSKDISELCQHIKEKNTTEIKNMITNKKINFKKIGGKSQYEILQLIVDNFDDSEFLELLHGRGFDLATKGKNEYNILLYASQKGKIEVLTWLLQQKNGKKLINEVNDQKLTALMVAANEECMELLLGYQDTKDSINFKDAQDNTALHYAIARGKASAVKILLDNGADCSIENADQQNASEYAMKAKSLRYGANTEIINLLKEADKKKTSELQNNVSRFINLIKNSDLESMEAMLNDNEINFKYVDEENHVKILMNIVDSFDQTQAINTLKILVAKGIDLAAKDSEGNSILAYISDNEEINIAILRWLLEQHKLEGLAYRNSKPLSDAINNSQTEAVQILIKYKPKLKDEIDDCLRLATQKLAEAKSYKENELCVKILNIVEEQVKKWDNLDKFMKKIQEASDDIIPQKIKTMFTKDKINSSQIDDKIQYKILELAANFDDTSILEYLVSRGINIKAKNSDKNNILAYAVQRGKTTILKFLLEKNEGKELANEVDALGFNALVHATVFSNTDAIEMLMQYNPNLKVKSSNILFYVKDKKSATILLKHQAVKNLINSPEALGNTALHHAAYRNYVGVVEALLDNTNDFNISNFNRDTALHIAVANGNIDVVRALLKKGADDSIKNKNSNTALEIAKIKLDKAESYEQKKLFTNIIEILEEVINL